MAWGFLSLAAVGVVADESPFARPPAAGVSYSYSQWLADASRREALGYAYSGVETFGSFVVTRDESLIGGLGEEWRRVLWETADIRQEMRAFVLAALNGEQYDWRLSGENKVLGLTNSLPDVTTDVLSDLAEAWAQSSGTVEHINVEWRSGLGERRAHIALDVVGGLRETSDDALAWQLRGYVTQDRNKGLNSGLIWRHAAADNTRLWGVNTFLDYEHTDSIDFWRWSFGLEGQWQAFDFSANQYVPISDQKVLGGYTYYTARGRDVQTYVRLAELLGDALLLDVAAGLTYYYWEGEGRGQGAEEGLIYGLRFGSYLNTPSPNRPLVLEIEMDDRQDVGARLSYVYYFNDGDNSASASGLYTYNALPYDARTHFYSPVRREYTQRIRRFLRQSLVYDILTRNSAGLRRTVLAVNAYAGVAAPITLATISVRSISGGDLVPGNPPDIVSAYSISLTGTNAAGMSLLANNITLQNNGILLITQQIAALSGRTVTAQMQLSGVSPSGLAFNLPWQIVVRDRTNLSPPRLTPPGGGSAEVGVVGNVYSARVPTSSDAVLLARVGVGGSVPPYIINLLSDNTQALGGISIVAASARLLSETPPHQVQIYGGYAEVVWRTALPSPVPFIFTIRTQSESGREQRDVVITVSPVPFVPAFSTVPGGAAISSPIIAGSAQALAVELAVPRYSGNPPYDYTLSGARASLFSIDTSAVGVRNARLANVAASSSSRAAPSNVALQISGGGSVRLLVNIPSDVAPLSVIHITVAVSDTGGRQESATLSTNIALPPFVATAPTDRSLDYYYSTVAASFAEQNLYTLGLSGSSGYYARPLAGLPGRLRFGEGSNSGEYLLRLLAGGPIELTTTMTIAYGDAYGRRGDIILTANVAPDIFAVRIFRGSLISRAVVGTGQVIATLGVQDPRGVGLDSYELRALDGSALAADLAAQVKLVSNTVFWTSGLGNGDATIIVGVRVVGRGGNTVSALLPLRFEVTDPPLVMSVVGDKTDITVNPVAGPILTVSIVSATDNNGTRTLSLYAANGAALPPDIAALFNVINNTVLHLAGNTPIITTLQLRGFDADGRRSTVVMLTVRALSFGLNADPTRQIQHFYTRGASTYTAAGLYTISFTGRSFNHYARLESALPNWLQFGAVQGQGATVYALSLVAVGAAERAASVTISYGDITGARGTLELTIETAEDAYVVLISQALNVVSREVVAKQVIASLGVQDPQRLGVTRYELRILDSSTAGIALAGSSLAAQVELVSNTISWISGGGNGAATITLGVRALDKVGAGGTLSALSILRFTVVDPLLDMNVVGGKTSITVNPVAGPILTVDIVSETDGGSTPRTLSLATADGSPLPSSIAVLFNVNNSVLLLVGNTPINTTLQLRGFDADGRRSTVVMLTVRAVDFVLNADSTREIQHFYANGATNFTAMGLYTISLAGSFGHYAQLENTLPNWLQFGPVSGQNGQWALNLLAVQVVNATALVTISYGDFDDEERGELTLTIETAEDAFAVLIDRKLAEVSRGTATDQIIAALDVQDSQNIGVASYEVLSTDGSALATGLAAQVQIKDSNMISWISGGGNGATVVTVGVQATGRDSAATKSPLLTFEFRVTDPLLVMNVVGDATSISVSPVAGAILTADIQSATDNNGTRTLSLYAIDGNALPNSIATLFSVNNSVLHLAGDSPVDTTLGLRGFDADGRRSTLLVLTVRAVDFRLNAGPNQQIQHFYDSGATNFTAVGLYTISLEGSSFDHHAQVEPAGSLPSWLLFGKTQGTTVWVLSLAAVGVGEREASVTISYGDFIRERGRLTLTIETLADSFAVQLPSVLPEISRGTATKQLIATVGVQDSQGIGVASYALLSTDGNALAQDLAAQVKIASNTISWTSGGGNGDVTITIAVQATGNDAASTKSPLLTFKFTVVDPPLAMNIIGDVTDIVTAPVRDKVIFTVQIHTTTDGVGTRTLSLYAHDGSALSPSDAALFHIQNSILPRVFLNGNTPIYMTLQLQGFDADGRRSTVLLVTLRLASFSANADSTRQIQHFYDSGDSTFTAVGLYTISLAGSFGHYAQLENTGGNVLPNWLRFGAVSGQNGQWAVSLAAVATLDATALVTISYGDFGSTERGRLTLTIETAVDAFAVLIPSALPEISRGTATKQLIATVGVQDSQNIGVASYALLSTDGNALAQDLAAQVQIASNTISWTSGGGNGDVTITIAVQATGEDSPPTNSPLLVFEFTVVDPLLVMNVVGDDADITTTPGAKAILTVSIVSATDGGSTPRTLSLYADNGNALPTSIAALFAVNNTILSLAGDEPVDTTLGLRGFDADGRRSDLVLFTVRAVDFRLNAGTNQQIQHFYDSGATNFTAVGLYTISLEGSSFNHHAQVEPAGSLPSWLLFGKIQGTTVWVLSLAAVGVGEREASVTISYGDFGSTERGRLTLTIETAVDAFAVLIPSVLPEISRGTATKQLIATVGVQDSKGIGVASYALRTADDSELATDLAAQVQIASNTISWTSGGGNGDVTITIAVQATGDDGTKSPLLTFKFTVDDPLLVMNVVGDDADITTTPGAKAILTVSIVSATDGGSTPRTLSLYAHGGGVLPNSIAALFAVNNTILSLADDEPVDTTLGLRGFDADGRRSDLVLFTVRAVDFRLNAGTNQQIQHFYDSGATNFTAVGLYTISLEGSSFNHHAQVVNTGGNVLPSWLLFGKTQGTTVWVLSLAAVPVVDATALVTISYGDFGSTERGRLTLTIEVAEDAFAVLVSVKSAPISRGTATKQLIATLGVQDTQNIGVGSYAVLAADGSALAGDLAARVELDSNTISWISGGNGATVITLAARATSSDGNTNSSLLQFEFTVIDPPLVMNVEGGKTEITVNPVAGPILTVEIVSETDGGSTPRTLSLAAENGDALPAAVADLFEVNNTILLLVGDTPINTTLQLQGFDAQGRRSTVVMLTVRAVNFVLNADSNRNIQHIYNSSATEFTAGELYAISLSGSTEHFARVENAPLPSWLTFGVSDTNLKTVVYKLSLLAQNAAEMTASITISYGDYTGEKAKLMITVETIEGEFIVLISSNLTEVSRGVETEQIIASLGVIDPLNVGVASYALVAANGGVLDASLAAQVSLDSTTISWVSGKGGGVTVITVGVQATGEDSPPTKSPVAQLIFDVIDPTLKLELGISSVSIAYTDAAQDILTVSVGSNTDGGAARGLTMFAEDGTALPAAVGAILSVNGTVLNVVGVTGDVTPIVTLITMQAVGLDAQGRRSDGLLFTLRLNTRFALEVNTATVRLAGLVRRNVLTITMIGASPQVEIEGMPSQLSLATLTSSSKLQLEVAITVETAYAANVAAANFEVTVHGSDSTSRPRTSQALTLRVTPFGLMLAGGQGPASGHAVTEFRKDVWRFDTTDRYWEEIGTLPTVLRNAAVLFHENTIYLFGGSNSTNTSAVRVGASNKVLYSTDGGVTWQESSAADNYVMPDLPNGLANAVPIIANGTLFLLGGRTTEGSTNTPDAASAPDINFVKAFALSGLGNSGSTWTTVASERNTAFSASHQNGYLQAAYQHFAGYHNGVMFMYGGRPDKSGEATFSKGNLGRFSYTSTPTTAAWRYSDKMEIVGVNSFGQGQDLIGGQVAVFGGQAFSIGNRRDARGGEEYLRINTNILSPVPAQNAVPNPLNIFSRSTSLGGLPPFGAIEVRYNSNGYRLFSLAKDDQPHLYMAGFGKTSGGMRVYRCTTATACVNDGGSTWGERAINTAISSNSPSRRSNFMLVGVNNISWDDN